YVKTAGLISSVSLGNTSNVYYDNCKSIVIESIISGIILFAILHGISLFLSRKRELAPLFFALFSSTILVRLIFTGKLYTFFCPFLTPYWYYKIYSIATFVMIPFYFLFIYHSYHQYINQKFLNIVMVLCAALFLLTTFSHPVHFLLFFSPLLVYQILFGICALYVVHLYSKIIYVKKSDTLIEFIGISIFLITAVFDIIVDRGSFFLPYIMPAGLSVFILLHSCQLSKRYSRSIESLNESLQRVSRLKDEFLAKTSHELRTPLHGIMGIAELLKQGAAGEINETISENLSLIIS
ncbi:MAG: 7TM diverse intracellular signaling domain-containing protein, partial [Fibrobacter sp.]|nr:7TM diverse intracellular signaling domain-containing protein [Fibrobacter sp.]